MNENDILNTAPWVIPVLLVAIFFAAKFLLDLVFGND